MTAVVFGVGDFCGGLATKRARVIQVVAGSHIVGAAGALIGALVLAERFDWGDVGLGAAGGAFGVLGVALLYRRLAAGPMSVVAPLTAITSAVVPTAWGIGDGERLSWIGWMGIGLGLVAVLLVSATANDGTADSPKNGGVENDSAKDDLVKGPERAPVTVSVVGESLLAGVGFGAMFIFLDATDSASAPWPVVGARVLTASLLVTLIVVTSKRTGASILPADTRSWWLIALVGVLDTGSNVTFLYASNLGQLSVVSVLSALYPISTVMLAWFVLGERMTKTQWLGVVAALAATELLVLG